MPANKPKFYLTTPIYYTNGLPHIGHTYSTIVCDTIRRYKRMRGYDVAMTTGTDEHGVNVERAAKKAGVPESEFVAKMAAEWKVLWDELGIPSDEFIRTTDLKHAHTVQWLFKLCRENGFVYPGHYTGQYCIYDNAPKPTISSNSLRFRSRFSIGTPSIRSLSSRNRVATKFSALSRAACAI